MPKVEVISKIKRHAVRARYIIVVLVQFLTCFGGASPGQSTFATGLATDCKDVIGIFVRGSGEEQNTGQNYLAFSSTLTEKLKTTKLSYGFIDLDYPAVGIDFGIAVAAFFSAGEAYKFGDSVKAGVEELRRIINSGCEKTKFVLGGYSQGAMVISKALPLFDADKILYAATFGDPKLYLPEGAGLTPAACSNRDLSNYRAYVPDCFTHNGKLGGIRPYQPHDFIDKLGTWCNKHDIMCSPYLSINSHTSYVADNLYEDASRKIFEKITDYFKIENTFFTPHDTVFLIDSTKSMEELIDGAKAEALRLAEETLANNGRVALYDYRDLAEFYEPVKHCDFESCTLEKFKEGLDSIKAEGGGDWPESLLSASFRVMQELNWKLGATKSMVVLTDSNFHNPDINGISLNDVVALSKKIDPVNFYIITTPEARPYHLLLAKETDGKVVTTNEKLNLLTDHIMERSDSLPRVEEADVFSVKNETLPKLEILDIKQGQNRVKVTFRNTGVMALISLDDAILGMTKENEVTIYDLDYGASNRLVITPLSDTIQGEGVEIFLETPLVPNTGQAQ